MATLTKSKTPLKKLMREFHTWAESRMPQKEAAARLGIHPRYLRKLYAGQHTPNDDIVRKITTLMAPSRARGPVKEVTKRPRKWKLVTYDEVEARRKEWGISKSEMALLLGVTNSTYHNWKRGIATANTNTQKRIRKILGGKSPKAHTGEDRSLSYEEQRLATDIILLCIERMPPMTEDGLVAVVEGVVAGIATGREGHHQEFREA